MNNVIEILTPFACLIFAFQIRHLYSDEKWSLIGWVIGAGVSVSVFFGVLYLYGHGFINKPVLITAITLICFIIPSYRALKD